MHRTQRADIDDFLAQRRIAVVGVSHDPKDFSRMLFRELMGRGYDLAPVHPRATEIEGIACARSVRDVTPSVDGALVMTSAKVSAEVVQDCAAAGVRRVWLYKGATAGAVSDEAVELCDRNGIAVVAGECPFMFLRGSGAVHGVHRFFKRLVGALPR
jgi:predicted CoA-binding protein